MSTYNLTRTKQAGFLFPTLKGYPAIAKSTHLTTYNSPFHNDGDELVNAEKYKHSSNRQGCRSGHYKRSNHTAAGEIELKTLNLKELPFETAIIERYCRKESSIEEALIEIVPCRCFHPDCYRRHSEWLPRNS